MFEVANRRVIVTGAAQGLGKEFVRRLLQVINLLYSFHKKILSENLISSLMLTNIHKTFLSTKVDRWQWISKVERPSGFLSAFLQNAKELSFFCKYLNQ